MKKIFRVLFVYITLCVVFVNVALAASAAVGTATGTIIDDIFQIAAYALTLIGMAVLTLLAKKIHDKWGITVPQAWLSGLNQYVDLGIAYAEEQGKKAVDAGAAELPGADKLDLALKFVLQFMGDDKQLVALGEDKLKQLIEAKLNQGRPWTSPTPSVVVNSAAATVTQEKNS